VATKTLVDEMESFDRVFQKDGALSLLTYDGVRKAKEDRSRLTGAKGSYIMYKAPGSLRSIRIDAFRARPGAAVRCAVDATPGVFAELQLSAREHVFGRNDYGFFDAVTYTAASPAPEAAFVRISLDEGVQIGRVELEYGPRTGPGGD
jgi:hypothetical protein